ncbi:hypothetical protein HMPREF2983_02760 [Prevotella sp. HMSC077E09]|uniref:hypothetical protein n=1 Tax=Prevotella sp. HMSC077E09 TaxID=1739487 RepID=UPI0008A2FCF9|nr:MULTISPECIES: hypothetical protein [unclassified Prevotella]OFO81566.1 hypothetical protein HMPREF3018_00165 [Prevotella sp. HMSC077E08]OFP48306.1 hypothetical protein HMPREF2983_02760 [Prevotella sp. HMSC077E09]
MKPFYDFDTLVSFLLPCNLYQMSFSFHSNGIVISVMLRAKVTGITTQEERSEDTEAVKWVRIRTKSTF